MLKILAGAAGLLCVTACGLLVWQHSRLTDAREEAAAMLETVQRQDREIGEIRAELAKRDAAIAARDAELEQTRAASAELMGRLEQVRNEKTTVRDWAGTLIPADVLRVLRAEDGNGDEIRGSDSSGSADAGNTGSGVPGGE